MSNTIKFVFIWKKIKVADQHVKNLALSRVTGSVGFLKIENI